MILLLAMSMLLSQVAATDRFLQGDSKTEDEKAKQDLWDGAKVFIGVTLKRYAKVLLFIMIFFYLAQCWLCTLCCWSCDCGCVDTRNMMKYFRCMCKFNFPTNFF